MTKKINKYQLLELICIFIITLFFNLVCVSMNQDEIWNYGFAYNIANGLIPYKDFNMVVTPLFPILSAIIMRVLGDSLLILHIINSVICTLIFKYMKKNYPKCYYIPYSIFLFYSLPNYNLLCLLFLYILLDLEKNNKNDYLIGLVIGLTFITKQNVGVYLLIPSILLNIKNIKKVSKRIIGFITPIIILLTYLILNNALYNFIDYCFLGMKEFASKNLDINYVYLIFLIAGIAYSIIEYIKTKEIKYLYLMFYNLIAFPIIEDYHVMLTFIPIFGFFLNNRNLNKRIISYTFIAFVTIVFTFNIYCIYTNKYNYPNETTAYKYRKLYPADANSIVQVSKYTKDIDDKLYLIISTAYLIRLENRIPTNKYDLLNNGNLGLNGETKLINEIDNTCKEKKCTFIIDITDTIKPESTQFNQAIVKHIINNYNEYGNIDNYELKIYKNY